MNKICITGGSELLGQYMQRFFLGYRSEVEVVMLPEILPHNTELPGLLKDCNILLHFESAHNANTKTDEVYEKNIQMVNDLLGACSEASVKPYIIYASSTHIHNDNSYGKSKKEVGEILKKWGKENETMVTNLIIPNEFGEYGKPYSTSVVSTFCHELVQGKESEINKDAHIALIHTGEIAKTVQSLIAKPRPGDITLSGLDIKVSEVYQKLEHFKEEYYKGIIPKLAMPIDVALFNTLRAEIFNSNFYPKFITVHSDDRGSLLELVKEHTGGQTFISTTKPGVTRGDHYHMKKIERFCVLAGEARIDVRDILSEKVISYEVSGEKTAYIDMPTFFTHNITNIGSGDLLTAFWSNEIFDPENPDTYAEIV